MRARPLTGILVHHLREGQRAAILAGVRQFSGRFSRRDGPTRAFAGQVGAPPCTRSTPPSRSSSSWWPRRGSSTRRCATASTCPRCASGPVDLPAGLNVDGEPSIWIHAVSVGEVLAARALVPELRRALSPAQALPVDHHDHRAGRRAGRCPRSTGSSTSRFDLPWVVRRVLDVVRPAALRDDGDGAVAEPAARVPRARASGPSLVNGRISARSFPRYRLVRPFIRRVLADVDLCCVQGEESHATPRRRSAPTRRASSSPAA